MQHTHLDPVHVLVAAVRQCYRHHGRRRVAALEPLPRVLHSHLQRMRQTCHSQHKVSTHSSILRDSVTEQTVALSGGGHYQHHVWTHRACNAGAVWAGSRLHDGRAADPQEALTAGPVVFKARPAELGCAAAIRRTGTARVQRGSQRSVVCHPKNIRLHL